MRLVSAIGAGQLVFNPNPLACAMTSRSYTLLGIVVTNKRRTPGCEAIANGRFWNAVWT